MSYERRLKSITYAFVDPPWSVKICGPPWAKKSCVFVDIPGEFADLLTSLKDEQRCVYPGRRDPLIQLETVT